MDRERATTSSSGVSSATSCLFNLLDRDARVENKEPGIESRSSRAARSRQGHQFSGSLIGDARMAITRSRGSRRRSGNPALERSLPRQPLARSSSDSLGINVLSLPPLSRDCETALGKLPEASPEASAAASSFIVSKLLSWSPFRTYSGLTRDRDSFRIIRMHASNAAEAELRRIIQPRSYYPRVSRIPPSLSLPHLFLVRISLFTYAHIACSPAIVCRRERART